MGARYGREWIEARGERALKRALDDASRAYMAGPDATAGYPVSYLDVFDLFDLIDREWDLFSYALPESRAWHGRVGELRHIRHRIAHCRAPHTDDLARLLQALRDLEHGARVACASYHDRAVEGAEGDPLMRAWGAFAPSRHVNLINHARRQYDTRFILRWSRRPWVDPRAPLQVSGSAGYLWHADFVVLGNTLDPRAVWSDYYLDGHRDFVLLATFSASSACFSFPALEDPGVVAGVIDQLFQVVLDRGNYMYDEAARSSLFDPVRASSMLLPPKVHVATPWERVTDGVHDWNVFGA